MAQINVGDVSNRLAETVLSASAKAISERGSFSVAVSGGSLPKLLAAGLAPKSPPLDKWDVFLADERIVPLHHDDSNYKAVRDRIEAIQIVPIDPQLEPEACAADYQRKIVAQLGEKPVFDCLLLGLGPDGHTCSLFPEHQLLEEKDRIVASIVDSPKPPPSRVTLTLPVINDARLVIFVCTGAGKAPVVKDIFENPNCQLPGKLVNPTQGQLVWLLDEAAASELSTASK